MQLTLKGEGHSAPHNGQNGDLLIVIKEQPHATLERNENNLFCTKIISVMDAMLGCEVGIPCIDCSTYRLKVDAGTQSGTVVKVRGKGLPTVNGGYLSSKGDMYVKILVWIPRKLSRDERSKLEEIRSSSSFTPDPSRDDKQLFEKEKKIY
jgi:molecular chaperone DnaJ